MKFLFLPLLFLLSCSEIYAMQKKSTQDPFEELDPYTRNALNNFLSCEIEIQLHKFRLNQYNSASNHVKSLLFHIYENVQKELEILETQRVVAAAQLEICMITSKSDFVKLNFPELYKILGV